MSKVVKDLNFEQIVTICNAIADCENACYDSIIANNDKREAMRAVGNAFDRLNRAIQDISDADDWLDCLDMNIQYIQKQVVKHIEYHKEQ